MSKKNYGSYPSNREAVNAAQQAAISPTTEEAVNEEKSTTEPEIMNAAPAETVIEEPTTDTAKEQPDEEIKTDTTVAPIEQEKDAVVEPVVEPVVGTVRVQPQQQPVQGNRRVQTFEYQCKVYVELSKNQIASEAVLKQKLYQFATIIRMIINSTDTEVYNAAYTFFKEHRNDILSEEMVFAYIHDIPTEQSIRMQTIYTTFREMVESNITKKPFALDYGLIRTNLKLPVQHPLLNWIRHKLGANN